MKWLFLLVSFLIIYGSVYPFEVNLREPTPAELDAFLASLRWNGTRGDILGNIALFVPYGFLAAFLIGRGWRIAAWFVWFPTWTLLLAFGIQVLQLYMPSREAALNDGLWNLLGTAMGFLPGLVMARILVARGSDANRAAGALISFPVVMAGCWIGYRLAPYVPSIDLQSWKDSLKPLLLSPTLSGTSTIRSAAGWMAFAALWRGWRGARFNDVLVVPMVLLVMFGEVLVVKNALTLSNVAGAAAGLALWWAVKWSRAGYAVAAGVLALAIGWSGLTPFAFGGAANMFHLVPFHGFLDGSMYVNVQQLFLKLYLYGSMAWLLVRAGLGYAVSLIAVATGVLGLELAQIYLPRKTPEITDPILALIAGCALWLLDRTSGASAMATGPSSPKARTDDSHVSGRPAQRVRSIAPGPAPQVADPIAGSGAPTPAAAAQTASAHRDTDLVPESKRSRARPTPPKNRSFVRGKDDRSGPKSFLR